MNILITRPLIDSENLMEKLFSMGHKIMHIPTLKILSTNMKPINPDDFDAFIFTSANAIRNLKLSNQNRKIYCFCVGDATEKKARSSGFQNVFAAIKHGHDVKTVHVKYHFDDNNNNNNNIKEPHL